MYTTIVNKKIRNYVKQSNTTFAITGVINVGEPVKPKEKQLTTNDSFLEAYRYLRDFQIPIKKTQIPRFKFQFDLSLWAKEQVKSFLSTGSWKFKLHSLSYETEMLPIPTEVSHSDNLSLTPQVEIA